METNADNNLQPSPCSSIDYDQHHIDCHWPHTSYARSNTYSALWPHGSVCLIKCGVRRWYPFSIGIRRLRDTMRVGSVHILTAELHLVSLRTLTPHTIQLQPIKLSMYARSVVIQYVVWRIGSNVSRHAHSLRIRIMVELPNRVQTRSIRSELHLHRYHLDLRRWIWMGTFHMQAEFSSE